MGLVTVSVFLFNGKSLLILLENWKIFCPKIVLEYLYNMHPNFLKDTWISLYNLFFNYYFYTFNYIESYRRSCFFFCFFFKFKLNITLCFVTLSFTFLFYFSSEMVQIKCGTPTQNDSHLVSVPRIDLNFFFVLWMFQSFLSSSRFIFYWLLYLCFLKISSCILCLFFFSLCECV